MITQNDFERVMNRTRQANRTIGAMGLHLPQWMMGEMGKVKPEVLGELYVDARDKLDTVQVLEEFGTWLLQLNAKGDLRYYPKPAELRHLLYRFRRMKGLEKGPTRRVPAWTPPPVDHQAETIRATLTSWWRGLTDVEREGTRRRFFDWLRASGQGWLASHLEDHLVRDLAALPLARVYLREFREIEQGVKAV